LAKRIQAIRGMNDILPEETPRWRHLEDTVRRLVESYGYQEIRLPLVEMTELFKRSIGEVTDIVEKEMYTFADRNGDSLTLRPEATASCVRAGIEHGLFHNQTQRLWYLGPMFRHERPQKGRYRQFHQVGVEAFGMPGPDIDAEMILMSARLWGMLGLDGLELQLNSLGSAECRAAYREELVAYLGAYRDRLDQDSLRRLERNPLRVLDSKSSDMQELIAAAPRMVDHLDAESAEHFVNVQAVLERSGVAYRVNPRLVRGLDYYGKTVFEWVTDELGAQGTLCAGGRFDGLVEQIGGSPTPAVGFALGIERVVAMLQQRDLSPSACVPHVYLVTVGEPARQAGLVLAERLRDQLPAVRVLGHCGEGGFKAQLKRADRSGAPLALIIGEEEARNGVVGVKYLRADREQVSVPLGELAALVAQAVAAS